MPIKNIIRGQKINPKKLHRARKFRSEMTPAEKVLWQALRGNKLGSHFRRQQVLEEFIVDFYCHTAGLIIELDGGIHKEQQDYDAGRDKVFDKLGLRILRYSNDDVLFNLPRVLDQLKILLGNKKAAI